VFTPQIGIGFDEEACGVDISVRGILIERDTDHKRTGAAVPGGVPMPE
jgi:hypothetical protein